MDSGNLFDAIPDAIAEEVFERIVSTETVTIERIVSRGQASPESGWYDQDRNEWVIVLQGSASIRFDNNETVQLLAGSYLNIPAHTRHRVTWTDPDQDTVWLAVHYT